MNQTENEKKNEIKQYSKEEMKKIWIHRIILFIIFLFVFASSALKPILAINPMMGTFVCFFLSALLSYFMSFTLYEYSKNKGIWVYILVIGVIVIMLLRYQ